MGIGLETINLKYMKTKEEILNNCLISGGKFMQVRNVETMIWKAMDEYADEVVKNLQQAHVIQSLPSDGELWSVIRTLPQSLAIIN